MSTGSYTQLFIDEKHLFIGLIVSPVLLSSHESWIVHTMWFWIGMGSTVLLLVVVCYPLRGWVSRVVRHRHRDGKSTTGDPRHKPTPQQWRGNQTTAL